jgi:hypothetical protein
MNAPAVRSGAVRIWLDHDGFVVWRSLHCHLHIPYEVTFETHAMMKFQRAIAEVCKMHDVWQKTDIVQRVVA